MRRWSAGVTATAVGIALGWAGAPAAQAAVFVPDWSGLHPGGDVYVAMGDSFASGPGIKPQRTTDNCYRSEKNYATLLATKLQANTFTDASCGGADTQDFATTQTKPVVARGPQYDALTPDATLVTLGTIGGNDVGLVDLAYSCVTGNCGSDPVTVDELNREIDALTPKLLTAIGEVRTRAPQADIVVVGYGTYIPDTSCASLIGVTPAEATYLQDTIDRMSDALGAAASQAKAAGDSKVSFADMRTIPGIAQHSACAAPEEQWIRAVNTYDDGAQLHPSTLGMANWSTRLKQYVQQARGQAVDPWVETRPEVPSEPEPPKPPVPPVVRPTPAQELKKAAGTLRLTSKCQVSLVRHGRGNVQPVVRVKLRVRGGQGLVRKVEFRAGRSRLDVDRTAPFTESRNVLKLVNARGTRIRPVRAKVTLRTRGVTRLKTVPLSGGVCGDSRVWVVRSR